MHKTKFGVICNENLAKLLSCEIRNSFFEMKNTNLELCDDTNQISR